MTLTTCACGFTELDDETFAGHIMAVFAPGDSRGAEGLIHEERQPLACSCGFTAITAEELDTHFIRAFVPLDAIGTDGNKHEAINGT